MTKTVLIEAQLESKEELSGNVRVSIPGAVAIDRENTAQPGGNHEYLIYVPHSLVHGEGKGIVIETITMWGQRNEPEFGELIATNDGVTWVNQNFLGDQEKRKRFGIYLGNNRVVLIREYK